MEPAAAEAMFFVVDDQAVAVYMFDVALVLKLVVAVVAKFAVAEAVVAVVGVVLQSAHKVPLLVAVCKSEVAPLFVLMTRFAAPYLFVKVKLAAEETADVHRSAAEPHADVSGQL